MSLESFMEDSGNFTIIDDRAQFTYTTYMLETVYAESLQKLAPNPNLTTYGMLVSAIVKNAFVLAGVISFVLLIFGGFQVIVSAGDAKKAEQGKAAVTGAVSGLLLVFGSYLFVQIIHVLTGIDIVNSGL